MHFFDVGVQLPVHAPALHTYGHTVPMFCQVPFASHFCGWRALHLSESGVQLPAQAPPLHTFAQGVPMSCQAPVASQT